MYYLNSLVVISLVVLSSFSIFRYLNNLKIPKNKIIVLLIYLLELIFVLISHNIIFYLFLDLPLFISYALNKRKHTILLLGINNIFYYLILNISLKVLIIYTLIMLLAIILSNNKDKSSYLLFIKVFVNSFLFFYYIDYRLRSVLLLIILFMCFNILIKVITDYITSFKDDDEDIMFKVAHEVKNPLAVCKGYLDMLDINDKEKLEKYIPIIKSEMNRSLTIMDNFLDTKRINIRKELMDLSLLLDDVKETVSILLSGKNIKIDFPKINDEIIIKGDYDKLKQVLINLIKNSYEANATHIKLIIDNINNYIDIKVIDNGIGISKDDINKIGTIFYTTKVTGNGLGIKASLEIVKQHNGKLTYDSSLNKGCCATIELPLEYIFKMA